MVPQSKHGQPPRVLLASNNPHKRREFRDLLAGIGVELLTPADLGLNLDVPEGMTSYAENAVAKARAFATASGLPSLADDSGLEVEALGGRPGVASARYGGPGLSDADRVSRLLEELAAVPWRRRRAVFRCVIAVALPNGYVETAEGTCRGFVATAPSGREGFGYDPVFYLPHRRRTMAELTPWQKNRLSHRSRAAKRAMAILRRLLRTANAS